jgi:hypothetical protein
MKRKREERGERRRMDSSLRAADGGETGGYISL